MILVKHILILVLLVVLLSSCIENSIQAIDPDEPVAVVGENQTINLGSYFILDGSKSEKGNGTKLSYSWKEDPNNPVKFDVSDDAIQYYATDKSGIYKYTLTVNNSLKNSKPVDLFITVSPRSASLIENLKLEMEIRFYLKKQTGQLSESDLLSVDAITNNSDLYCAGGINSLKGIENCKNLKRLHLPSEWITDLTPLANLNKLEYLDLDQSRELTDVRPLSNLTMLKYLDLYSTNISDISSLSKLVNLEYLNLYLTELSDVSVISNFKKLKEFKITGLKNGDVTALKDVKDLEVLFAPFCEIKDISSLANLANLKVLYLMSNKIENISALSNKPDLYSLYLGDNNIEDISVLEHLVKLVYIELGANKIKNIEPLVKNLNIGKGTLVDLKPNPLDEKSLKEYIPDLVARGVVVLY